MGEIKSTLDLVMEKTRNLTLSHEEKEKQKQDEIKKRIKGLLLKYQDKAIDTQQLKNELADLRSIHRQSADQILRNEILDTVDMDQDNTPRLGLLKEFFGLDIKGLEALLNEYQEIIAQSAKKRVKQIKENLSKHRYISGSAVVPNLDGDTEWLTTLRVIKTKSDEKFTREKEHIKQKINSCDI